MKKIGKTTQRLQSHQALPHNQHHLYISFMFDFKFPSFHPFRFPTKLHLHFTQRHSANLLLALHHATVIQIALSQVPQWPIGTLCKWRLKYWVRVQFSQLQTSTVGLQAFWMSNPTTTSTGKGTFKKNSGECRQPCIWPHEDAYSRVNQTALSTSLTGENPR